ncbi:MAG: hypothetical protein E6G08_10860 [Actinobacteria bacterium]|nr:MAG: hypothetical protein E6G08_10860 [Actinomycetota bacterium]
MKKAALVLLACVALLAPGRADAAKRPAPAYASTCGLPAVSPMWIDYGWPDMVSTFARPGIVLTTTGAAFTEQLRAAGVPAVFFDLNFKNRVGQPSDPTDPSTMVDRANRLFDYAVQQAGCPTPTIVENELFGAGLVTPWSDTNTTYRANVLTFLQQLASRGAHPVLLVNSPPYTANEAGDWWRSVAAVSDIVREDYVPATIVWKQGATLGGRTLRNAYRRSIQDFTSIGIEPQHVGVMVSFSTTPGFGGRNGLQPTSAWLQVAKWQALSAQAIAAETGISSVWTWGWGQWTAAEQDPDKPLAACVWLWTRDPGLCDATAQAGSDFDASRTEGQVRLPAGVQCLVDGRALSNDAIQKLQLMTGDRDTAFTGLYERLVESKLAPVSGRAILAAEQYVIATRFNRSQTAYAAALAQAHATVQIARGILGDELRRSRIELRLPGGSPSAGAVESFYTSYPDLLARSVQAKKTTPWLPYGKTRGLILSALAPGQLFSGGARTVWTPLGSVAVKPLGEPLALGAVPLEQARPAIVAALRHFARGEAFERWTEAVQKKNLDSTACARDDLPQPAAVELSTYLPFLRL